MLILIWGLALVCIAVWSLTAWGLHAVLTADPNWVDDVDAVIRNMPLGEWIERWFPGWRELLHLALELAQTALAWVGSAAPLVVWVTWGVGVFVVLMGAGGLTLLVLLARSPAPQRPVPPPR